MWKNWEKEIISNRERYYTLPLHLEIEKTKMVVELTVMIRQISDSPEEWKVLITTHHRSSGEYIVFEDTFQSLQDAEMTAWDQAQQSINIRKDWLT
jgi:hypothetical protein